MPDLVKWKWADYRRGGGEDNNEPTTVESLWVVARRSDYDKIVAFRERQKHGEQPSADSLTVPTFIFQEDPMDRPSDFGRIAGDWRLLERLIEGLDVPEVEPVVLWRPWGDELAWGLPSGAAEVVEFFDLVPRVTVS